MEHQDRGVSAHALVFFSHTHIMHAASTCVEDGGRERERAWITRMIASKMLEVVSLIDDNSSHGRDTDHSCREVNF